MGIKDGLDKVADKAKGVVDDAKDSISEAGHRSSADAERAKRDVAGDDMTTGQKVGSFVNEKKNDVQADVDASKRDVRNNT